MTVTGAAYRGWDFATETIKTAVYLCLSPCIAAVNLIRPDDQWGEGTRVATMLGCRTAVRIGVFVETFFGGNEEEVKVRYLALASCWNYPSLVKWMLDEEFPVNRVSVGYIVDRLNYDVAKLLVEHGGSAENAFEHRMPDDIEHIRYFLEKGAQLRAEHYSRFDHAVALREVEVVRLLLNYNIQNLASQEDKEAMRQVMGLCDHVEICRLVNDAFQFDQE